MGEEIEVKRAIIGVAVMIAALFGVKAFVDNFLFGVAAPDAPGSSTRPANVLLITLDTTRADRIGAYGYAQARTPNLDALAREGVLFTDATTQAPITGPAHAAIMTGMYPAKFGVRDNATTPLPDSALTLAEALKARGFETAGFIGAFILDRPYGFAQGFDRFDGGFARVDSGSEANASRRGDAVVDDARRWLDTRTQGRPFFAWVHLYDPHTPYDGGYDAEISFADAQIGRLFETLRARGLYDNTLIIVTADHGESLGEHGEEEHGIFLYDSVMRVPLIARGPGLTAGRAIREQVRTIDLFPTVLGALGAPIPEDVNGSDVWPVMQGARRTNIPPSYAESYYPKLHFGWSELRAIRADGLKAIDAPTPELYDLRVDPGETRNLYQQQKAVADRMIADAARVDRELTGGKTVAVKQPDADTLERLRSLGYVGSVTSSAASGERGADPKDHIRDAERYRDDINAAIDDLRGGNPARAEAVFKRLLRQNERAFDLHVMLGEAYERQKKLDQALGEYEMAAILNPSSASARTAAAEIRLAKRDVAGALALVEEAAKLDPSFFEVALMRGRIHEAQGQLEQALDAYKRAVSLNPANPRSRLVLSSLASRMRRIDVAEAEMRELLRMGYQPSRTHMALGQLAQMRGAPAEAVEHFREALRLEPGQPMAIEALRRLGVR